MGGANLLAPALEFELNYGMDSLLRRPRRLRATAALRDLVRETRVAASDLILPLFVSERVQERTPVTTMPGVFQWTVEEAAAEALAAQKESAPVDRARRFDLAVDYMARNHGGAGALYVRLRRTRP